MEPPPFPPAGSFPGTLHYIPPNLSAFEPHSTPSSANTPPQNTLLWIGGLMDTPLSVAYPLSIPQQLPQNWTLLLASLSSSGKSWGVASISQDASDISKLTSYIRSHRPNGKIILMGHSTGCQDCMSYVLNPSNEKRERVDGIILQAPVSDREALANEVPALTLDQLNTLAEKYVYERKGRDCLPYEMTKVAFGRSPITAQRWLDLTSPGPEHRGADDFFSSDFGEERLLGTFGKIAQGTGVCVLHMGKDEAVAEAVDKGELVRRFGGCVGKAVKEGEQGWWDEGSSGVVEGATHNLNGCEEKVVRDLVERVGRFVRRVEEVEVEREKGVSSRI